MGGLRISIIVLMLFIIAFSGCGKEEPPPAIAGESEPPVDNTPVAATTTEKTAEPPKLDEIPVSRAEVAKMLALTFLTPDEIEDTEDIIVFSDVKREDWHFKYINAAVSLNYMLGGEGEFRPDAPLSIYEAQLIIDRVDTYNKTQIKITPETKDMPISYALWRQLYIKALAELADASGKTTEQQFGLQEVELTVLATPANADVLPKWSMVTDKGAYFFKGMSMDGYVDGKISVFAKKKEIAAVSEVQEGAPIIESAYVRDDGNGQINVYAGGARRTYAFEGSGEIYEIANVRISGQRAEIISSPTDKKEGLIKRVTDKYIELEDGKISTEKNIPVYILDGDTPVFKEVGSLIAGTRAVFYLSGGKILAAVAQSPSPSHMRVQITSSDYKTSVHTSVKIGATSDFTVSGEEGEKKYKKGDCLVFDKENNNSLFSSERLYITPDDENGRIELQSITRSGESPKYRGTIEISKEGEAFVIVNELELEKYLNAVVSSQIPEALGETAAKAQAVVSRSIAYSQYFENRCVYYGANVDDSVKSQLYNASPETETSIRAVEDTAGKVLAYNGETIKPAFFLASGGYTANRGEAFPKPGGTKFPSDTPSYLKAAKQYEGADYGDLSIEENAALFFKDSDINANEKDVSWFRWNVTMSKEELEASINANTEPIGQFVDMEVTRRGEGGNVMELKIIGTEGEFFFETESTIRALIKPYQYMADRPPIVLNRADGTSVENYNQMPSAFYVFDIERGENTEILSITFCGGGNGHGVGMSQCGAKALADSGASYEDILKHYFSGIDIKEAI